MERKAWENLAAARVLLEIEEPCPNAAASRACYAAYHACWHAMNEAGIPTPEVRPGVYYFLHEPLPRDAVAVGVLDEQASDAVPIEEQKALHSRLFRGIRRQLWEEKHLCLMTLFHTPENTDRFYAWVREEHAAERAGAARATP